jgi:hypothetical protein
MCQYSSVYVHIRNITILSWRNLYIPPGEDCYITYMYIHRRVLAHWLLEIQISEVDLTMHLVSWRDSVDILLECRSYGASLSPGAWWDLLLISESPADIIQYKFLQERIVILRICTYTEEYWHIGCSRFRYMIGRNVGGWRVRDHPVLKGQCWYPAWMSELRRQKSTGTLVARDSDIRSRSHHAPGDRLAP